ncbi:MAG TPA: ABC transporter permease, partial [Ktedonobacterales bacterium]|nr:ABC transporter permease [Ktedonobacterales bacterium]
MKQLDHAALPDELANAASTTPTASASATATPTASAVAFPARQPHQQRKSWWDQTVAFISKTLAIAEWEVRKLRHDPTDIFVRTVQPALWLLVFGETFSRFRAINTGHQSYLQFLAPGILAQSVLFLAIFYGIAIIWERDLGVTHKFLASPTPRVALVLGKALSAGVRALPQA